MKHFKFFVCVGLFLLFLSVLISSSGCTLGDYRKIESHANVCLDCHAKDDKAGPIMVYKGSICPR
jgi:hypothetical protein